jgi:hypothetical protein
MAQNILPFKYEAEKKEKNLTALCGLLLYLGLFKALKLYRIINQIFRIKANKQGYGDDQIILALILLNLAGGDSVSDIKVLEKDEGFCRILRSMELHGTIGRRRTKIKRRWRQKIKNTVASPSSIFRYLAHFHNPEEEKRRKKGTAFIPRANEHLSRFPLLNSRLLYFLHKRNPVKRVTLDMDATLAATNKQSALHNYKGYKSYQPFNVWWNEMEFLLHSEFRDGNVPAGHEQLRMLKESLAMLPEEVEEVYVRSDTAGYQHELLKYCDVDFQKRFGRIHFAVGCDVTPAFKWSILSDKNLLWHPIYKQVKDKKEESGQEWSEVCFVPNELARSKKGREYRYIAIREELAQKVLPGMENNLELPFPTMEMENKRYKLTALVTNLEWYGEEVVHWYRQRCGKSEEVHSIMKDDLAGGRFPSADFGENAAWWWIMILALNIQTIMKQFVLGKAWKNKRMKLIRFHIINIPGRIVKTGGGKTFIVKISNGHPSLDLLNSARERIQELSCLPSG